METLLTARVHTASLALPELPLEFLNSIDRNTVHVFYCLINIFLKLPFGGTGLSAISSTKAVRFLTNEHTETKLFNQF